MATRNNGDGPPAGKSPDERPGSYVKIAGSRRRRRGRKQAPSLQPAAVAGAEQPRDRAVGESARGSKALDDASEPSVDDLRFAAAPSTRAPRRSPGPLGMEDARSGEPPPPEAPSSVAHVRVIEINSPPRPSDNTNDQPRGDAALHAPPWQSVAPDSVEASSRPPAGSRRDDERFTGDAGRLPSHDGRFAADASGEAGRFASGDDRFASDDELPDARPSPPPEPEREHPSDSERVPPARLLGHGEAQGAEYGFTYEQTGATPSRGFSSVLNARASMRPSPPPPPRSVLGWWLAIMLLMGIIAAAVVVAVRERTQREEADLRAEQARSTPAPASEPAPTPQPDAPQLIAPQLVAPRLDAPRLDAPRPNAPRLNAPAPVQEPATGTGPAASGVLDAGVAVPDAGSKTRVRVWRPRKPVPAPAGSVPANPYGASSP